MPFTRSELVTLIRGFALLYLEVEAARRPARALIGYGAPALVARLPHAHRRPVAGRLAVGGVDYAAVGDTIRAAATVYRGGQVGALLLTFRRAEGGWRLAAVEAPDYQPLPGL
jgi:hypothetical protein